MSQHTRILFADDDRRILSGLRRQLHGKSKEWDIAFVDSGAAALAALEAAPRDVIVSDMRMPGMDGAELLSQVTRRWPRMGRMVLSGQADHERMQIARTCAHRYLNKPCPPDVLVGEIERARRVRHVLDRMHCDALDDVWSRPPAVTDLCEDMIAALGDGETAFSPDRMFRGDATLWSRVRDLMVFAYPESLDRTSDPAQLAQMLGNGGLFGVTLAVRFVEAFVSQDAETWDDASRVAVHAAAIAQHAKLGPEAVQEALLTGLLSVVQLPDRTSLQLEDGVWEDVIAYLLESWGTSSTVVRALAQRPLASGDPKPGPLASVLAAEVVIGGPDLTDTRLSLIESYLDTVGWSPNLDEWARACRAEIKTP